MALTVKQAKTMFKSSKRKRRQAINSKNYSEYKWNLTIPYSFKSSIGKFITNKIKLTKLY